MIRTVIINPFVRSHHIEGNQPPSHVKMACDDWQRHWVCGQFSLPGKVYRLSFSISLLPMTCSLADNPSYRHTYHTVLVSPYPSQWHRCL